MEQRSYETQDGEKRTVYDIVADEVGPSLRWATCQIERTERSQGGDGGYHATEQRAASGGTGYGGDNYEYGDEDPF
jgi:single-strand DNA-binding protein